MKCRACGYKWQEIEGSPDVTEGFKTISDDVMRFEKIEGNFTYKNGNGYINKVGLYACPKCGTVKMEKW